VLNQLPAANVARLTGREFFPALISEPFQRGLFAAFLAALVMTLVGALASALQGKEREVEVVVPAVAPVQHPVPPTQPVGSDPRP
jgi:uncharacterized membrane protein YjjB (DUF3815 family)